MILAPLASVMQLLYALFLVAVGAFGIFFLDWEVATFYGLHDPDFEGVAGATLRNQFRFLKAIELGFGLFGLFYRREIMAGGLAASVFLIGVALGAFARALSWWLDGTPAMAFQIFLWLELLVLVTLWLHVRAGAQKP